jgi:hypothetical protein
MQTTHGGEGNSMMQTASLSPSPAKSMCESTAVLRERVGVRENDRTEVPYA